jgi:PKD repeat protein
MMTATGRFHETIRGRWIARLLAGSRPLAAPLALAVLLASSIRLAEANNVSGTITYLNKIYDPTQGFTGGTEILPVRQAEVEVINNATDAVLGSGVTGNDGAYSIAIPDGGLLDLRVRVYARRLLSPTNSIYSLVVMNNGAALAVYTAATVAVSQDTSAVGGLTIGVAIPLGSSPPFNIFDVAVLTQQYVHALDAAIADPPLLTLYWESGATDGTYFQIIDNSIHLLGTPNDSDEWDDDVICHELGHYVASNFSKDDSPGGGHTVSGHYDIRLTWSEGWAHYWSSAVRLWTNNNPGIAPIGVIAPRYPDYIWNVDTLGPTSYSAFEISTPSYAGQAVGADNELSVAAVLWNIPVDTPLVGARIWNVVHNRLPSRFFISFEDFYIEWNAVYPSSSLAAILASRTIRYVTDDLEPNDSKDTATPFEPNPVVGAPRTLAARTFFKSGPDPVGDEDWFSFTALAGQVIRIETTNLGDGADTFLVVYASDGATRISQSDDRVDAIDLSSLVIFTAPATDTYYFKVAPYPGDAPYSDANQLAQFGSYDLAFTIQSPGVIIQGPEPGPAPLAADFIVDPGVNRASIYRYEWDFDGDLRVDYDDPAGGSVRHAYTRAGSYTATLRLTDKNGQSIISTVPVTVLDPPDPLSVSAAASSTNPGVAPASVAFTATVTGGSAVLYEWDFDGDGFFDSLDTADLSPRTHTYAAAGAYAARLRVTDSLGRTYTASTDSITVGDPPSPPSLVLVANVAGGEIPFLATLTATSTTAFARYEWDFDGDGRYDLVTTSNAATFLCTKVGRLTPRVRATDAAQNLTATAETLLIATAPGPIGWMVWPRAGQRVTGNAVTVAAQAVPAGSLKTVEFQFSLDGKAWTSIGPPLSGLETLFMASWDTSGIPDGTTDLRLRVMIDGVTAPDAVVAGLSISSATPDVTETASGGTRSASAALDLLTAGAPVVNGDTILLFPLGSLSGGSSPMLAFTGGGVAHVPSGSTANLAQYGGDHGLAFQGAPTVAGRFRLRIFFRDANGDGIVDGTAIPKGSLSIHYFDAASSAWKQDVPSDVAYDGNWVETELWHLTDFGLFGSPLPEDDHKGRCFAGAAGLGSGVTGGVVSVLVIFLAAARRRRPAHRPCL